MTILVTGLGLVGANLSRKFIDEGYRVICYDRTEREIDFLKEKSNEYRFLKGDILNREQLMDTANRYDVQGIIHTAIYPTSNESLKMFKVNVEGSLNVLEVAKAKKIKIVNISTGAVYGHRPNLKPLKEDEPLPPITRSGSSATILYTFTKRMGEELATMYNLAYGVDVVTVRASYVYGPADHAPRHLKRGIAFILRKALRNEPLEISQGGDEKNDYTYVKDLANGIYLAFTVEDTKHRLFNISSGKLSTMSEVAQIVKKIVPGVTIELGPGAWPEMGSAFLRGPFDLSRAHEELGYAPKYTLQEGIEEYAKWLRKNPSWL